LVYLHTILTSFLAHKKNNVKINGGNYVTHKYNVRFLNAKFRGKSRIKSNRKIAFFEKEFKLLFFF